MADKLTPQQHQAVHDRGGDLLISAAAGSGKTKVLVDRLMGYLQDPRDPANLDDFLIITYTKAAASELRGKIARKLSELIAQQPENRHLQKQMQRLFLTKISTVHGFCADVVREYAYRLDIAPDFRVADENEYRELRTNLLTDLLDRAYTEKKEDPDFRAFVDTQGLGRTDSLVPMIIERVFDSAQCHMDPRKWLDDCLAWAEAEGEDTGDTIWGRFLMEDLYHYLDDQIRVMGECLRLAQNCEGFEKPSLVLADTLNQLQELRRCSSWDTIVANRAIDYGRLTFPRKNPDPVLSDRIKAARGACKKGLDKKLKNFTDPSSQILGDLSRSAAATRGLVQLVAEFAEGYRQAKRSRRVLDFGDLEHRTLDLLLGKNRTGATAAAGEISRRYREIMVDEYQDSNGVQDAIFAVLTRQRSNCFMVGDVKQSIYQFRLADPSIFLEKYHRYVPADEAQPREGRKVLLSHNFRSGGEVIEAVNDVFKRCMCPELGGLAYGPEEMLREGIPHNPMPDTAVEFYALQTQEDTHLEEAAFVAERICQMLTTGTLVRDGEGFRPVRPEDIVILLRSPGSVGKYYQRALERKGIRCASGGGKDLLQTQEIGTARSFLQVIVNPRQDIPLISTLASPIFGFTADDLAQIRGKNKYVSVYDALASSDHPKAVSFLQTLKTLRREARTSSLSTLLQRCFECTHLDSIYAAMPGGDAKLANLQTFYQLATQFESGSLRDLGQFLEHLDALEQRGLLQQDSVPSDCVTIMSIHKSKGLEFPVVFLCGLARAFNTESLKAQILCDRNLGLGLSVADPQVRVRYPSVAKRAIMAKVAADGLSEEMRVLYVAMTRPRDRLVMTYASRYLQTELEDITQRMDFDGGKLVCMDAANPGKWVLLTALGKTEAGELHAVGGRPMETTSSHYPWKIRLIDQIQEGESFNQEGPGKAAIPAETLSRLKETLSFRYPHLAATRTPSKQTATERKGRPKDQEAAEDTDPPRLPQWNWRKPQFLQEGPGGKQYGNAVHKLMQYIRYEVCADLSAVEGEVARLLGSGVLTPEQGDMIPKQKIAAFFATDLGRKLASGTPYLREFKFSILEDAGFLDPTLVGEQVLLQGVVDCALLEADGITVLDFKTDYITEQNLSQVVDRYRGQIGTYANALQRIYQMPIKAKYLYLFSTDQFVEV